MSHTFFRSLSFFYKEHLWTKISAFLGLLLSAGCIIIFSGGFPPWAWRFLVHVLTQLPSLWVAQGSTLLPALLGLLLISLSLLIVWVVLVFLLIKVSGQIWSDMGAHQRFERDLAEAEFLAQEQADWTREQDAHDRLTQPETRGYSAAKARPSSVPQQEQVHTTRDEQKASARGEGVYNSRVRRTVPLIPPSRPLQEPVAQQPFRPINLPQRNMNDEISFAQSHAPSAPHRLHMVPHISSTTTVEDSLLPESFHQQRRGAASMLDRQTAYNAGDDDEVPSVWGERQSRYAEQDTRRDWWDEEDEIAEEDEDAPIEDDEEWDDDIATQQLEDMDYEENEDVVDDEEETEDKVDWQQEVRDEEHSLGYDSIQSGDEWNEEETQVPTREKGASQARAAFTPVTPEEEIAAPLTDDSTDAHIQEQAANTHITHDIRLLIGIGLDPGLSRKHSPNEDSVFAIEGMRVTDRGPQPAGLFIVADGMGGHANGREASHTAVNSMSDAIIPSLLRETCDRTQTEEEALFLDMLKQGVHQANLALYQKNREARSSMGTTLTAALIVNLTAYVVNVGDSRTYLYRPTEGLMQVTRDHSVVARMVEVGAITKDDVYTHPKRNQIYRCLGEHATVDTDTFTVPVSTVACSPRQR